MALKILSEDVKSHLRNGIRLSTVQECVIELILNSLDAKASSIAIQLNLRTFRVQVVDNGDGISKSNMVRICTRYCTNKCHSLNDYRRKICYYGFRGESLACISEMCCKMSIVSREIGSEETFLKMFENQIAHSIVMVKYRPSEGTTITLENVLYNMSVRQKRVNPEVEFDYLKDYLLALSIVHPNVSFTLRNDATNKMLFKNEKYNTVADALSSQIGFETDIFTELKFKKKKLRLTGILSKEMYKTNKFQLLYVNKRPVNSSTIHKLLNSLLKPEKITKKRDVHPVYAIHVKCSLADVELTFENNKTQANFADYLEIVALVERMANNFLGKEKNPTTKSSKNHERIEQHGDIFSDVGLSEIAGLVRSRNPNKIIQEKSKEKTPLVNVLLNESPKASPILDFASCSNNGKKLDLADNEQHIVPKHQRNSAGKVMLSNDHEVYKDHGGIKKKIHRKTVPKRLMKVVQNTNLVQLSPIENRMKNENVFSFDDKNNKEVIKNKNLRNSVPFDKNILLRDLNGQERNSFFRRYGLHKDCQNLPENILMNNIIKQPDMNVDMNAKGTEILNDVTAKSQEDYNFDLINTIQVSESANINHQINLSYKEKMNDEKAGKAIIMNAYLKSTQGNNRNANNKTVNLANSVRQTNVLNTTIASMAIIRSNVEKLHASKCMQTSMFIPHDSNSKCVQTSFMGNITMNNQEHVGNDKSSHIYHINFHKLNFNDKEKVDLNVDLNHHNMNFKFDINQSKYFKCKNCENKSNCKNLKTNDQTSKANQENHADCNKLNAFKSTNIINNNTAVTNNDSNIHGLNDKENEGNLSNIINVSKYFLKTTEQLEILPNLENDAPSLRDQCSINKVKDTTIDQEIIVEAEDSFKDSAFFNVSNLNFESLNRPESGINDIHAASSKIDIDINSGIYYDGFKDKCLNNNQGNAFNVNSDIEMGKKGIKRYSTDPVKYTCVSQEQKASKEFLSQGISSSDEDYNDFVKSIQNKRMKDTEIVVDPNNSVISSNLMREFFDSKNNTRDSFDKNNVVGSAKKEWITQVDHGAKFFLHQDTGLTTYKHPSSKVSFNLKKRNEYIPKGQSPVIMHVNKCRGQMSQNSKETLYEGIVKSFENEVDLVKWQHFIKEQDSKTFFTALFQSRTKQSVLTIPNVSKNILPKSLISMYNREQSKEFSDNLFKDLEVIGQLDCKFILALYKYEQLIVIFDQHAVHERIKLEQLQTFYTNDDKSFKSSCTNVNYTFKFTQSEIEMLDKYYDKFNSLGLFFTISDHTISVHKVPSCLQNKFNDSMKKNEEQMKVILLGLFEETLINLRNTRGCTNNVPKVIKNILNSEACRGAIKFGESLTNEMCQAMLKDLSKCHKAFQCAHGRPTLMPLIRLTDYVYTI